MGGKKKPRGEMNPEELKKARAYHSEWNKRNREKIRKYQQERAQDPEVKRKRQERERKKYREDPDDRQKQIEYSRKYREEHPEWAKMSQERYRSDPVNREKARVKSEKWRSDFPEKHILSHKESYEKARVKIHTQLYVKKKQCVDLLGGKCECCGTDNLVVLQFHHIDLKTKSFEIGKEIRLLSMDILLEEIVKCQLLCANCHMMIHNRKHWE